MSHTQGYEGAVRAILLALLLALGIAAACGDPTIKGKADGSVDTGGSGSSAPCVLDTSKLDSCSL